jgi:hypothetical protein
VLAPPFTSAKGRILPWLPVNTSDPEGACRRSGVECLAQRADQRYGLGL